MTKALLLLSVFLSAIFSEAKGKTSLVFISKLQNLSVYSSDSGIFSFCTKQKSCKEISSGDKDSLKNEITTWNLAKDEVLDLEDRLLSEPELPDV